VEDVGERIALGFAEAERQRRANVEGAEVREIDGLLLAFANVPDPPVNSVLVISEPADPVAALTAAERAFRERDRPLGVDIAVGRHPSVDIAIREIGLTRLFAWPGMAVDVADLPETDLPDGIRVEPVTDERGAAAIAHVEQVGFDSQPEVAERFYAAASYGVDGGRSFVAWDGEEPVGMAAAYLHAGAIGIFGVAVVPASRRRGIASALSVIAARSFPADLAWLHTDDPQARSVYERLGFREVAQWEVWVRPEARP
jgi:ribosomal protein S18 acetylase RimI-like enzyme